MGWVWRVHVLCKLVPTGPDDRAHTPPRPPEDGVERNDIINAKCELWLQALAPTSARCAWPRASRTGLLCPNAYKLNRREQGKSVRVVRNRGSKNWNRNPIREPKQGRSRGAIEGIEGWKLRTPDILAFNFTPAKVWNMIFAPPVRGLPFSLFFLLSIPGRCGKKISLPSITILPDGLGWLRNVFLCYSFDSDLRSWWSNCSLNVSISNCVSVCVLYQFSRCFNLAYFLQSSILKAKCWTIRL